MTIKNWPVAERPREKLLQFGAASLSDAELLAIILRTGTRGQTAVDLARSLLLNFGGLRSLLQASRLDFCRTRGLGEVKYIQLQATLEIARRHLYEEVKRGDILANPLVTRRYLTARIRDYQHEVFLCLFLDSQNQLLACDELFHGTIDGASVYPREVLRSCLAHNAAAVIFAHNHPSGQAEPSQADRQITKTLQQALELVDIRVLDHFIVGNKSVLSFAERGLL